MTTPSEIRKVQRKRFMFLKHLYDDSQTLADGHVQSLSANDVAAALQLTPAERHRIEDYLEKRGLVEFVSNGPFVAITAYGIDYVEGALAEPEQPTQYFPPVNILHIERIENSQVQQGTVSSRQWGQWTAPAPVELLTLIAEVRNVLNSQALTDRQREFVQAHILTVEAQAAAPEPNHVIIREALRSLRNVAEQVGAALIAGKLAAALMGLPLP